MATITAIDGITDARADKLREAGVRTTDALLTNANTKKRREKLSKQAGISEKVILDLVNQADLMRVKGVSAQSAALLKAAGVDTLKELKRRNAENLAEAMEQKNSRKKTPIVKRAPSAKTVEKWVEEAKSLKPVVKN